MKNLIKNNRGSFTIETILYIQIVFFVLAFFIFSYIFYTKKTYDIYSKESKKREEYVSNAETIRRIDTLLFTIRGIKK